MKLIKKFFIIIMIIITTSAIFFACGSKGTAKTRPTLADATQAMFDTTNRKMVLSADAKISFYNAKSEPGSIGQLINMTRYKDGANMLIEGTVKTGVLSGIAKSLITTVVNMLKIDMITNYLTKGDMLAFKLGYNGANFNALGDYVTSGESIDYSITDSDGDITKLFFGVNVADIDKFISDMELSLLEGFDIIEMMNSGLILDFGLSNAVDTASAKYNRGEKCYLYNLTLSGDTIKAYIIDMINKSTESLAAEEDESFTAMIELYNQHKEKIFSWILVDDFKVNAKVDSNGRLIEISQQLGLRMSIPDSDIISIAVSTGQVSEDEVKSLLSTVHFLIGSANGLKDRFDVRLDLNIAEKYEYDTVTINMLDDAMLTETHVAEGRTYFFYTPSTNPEEQTGEWSVRE